MIIQINRKAWTSGTGKNERYQVTHDGSKVKVIPLDWSSVQWKIFPKGSPNISLRHAVFKKLGIGMNSGGEIFVPWEYMKKTGRKTFRGMSFGQISDIQRKCGQGTYR